MKLNKHEQAKPNIAGLTSPVQLAEMKLILAGRWPPLKPLPLFKYETDRTFTQGCRPDKWRAEKSRLWQPFTLRGAQRRTRRRLPQSLSLPQPTGGQPFSVIFQEKTDRRLLFVRDDLATFCSCFSGARACSGS